jgi:ParB-like chromosome segregation protein Spo0J
MSFRITARQALEEDLRNSVQEYNDAKYAYLEWIVAAAAGGMTQREIANIVGKSYTYVQNVLRGAGVTYEHRAIVTPPGT